MTVNQPHIRAVPMSLFPTLNSLQDCVDMATAQLPVTHVNQMQTILMTYHNTLLNALGESNVDQTKPSS